VFRGPWYLKAHRKALCQQAGGFRCCDSNGMVMVEAVLDIDGIARFQGGNLILDNILFSPLLYVRRQCDHNGEAMGRSESTETHGVATSLVMDPTSCSIAESLFEARWSAVIRLQGDTSYFHQ